MQPAAHTIHTYFKIEKIVEQMTSRPDHKSPKKFIICHIAALSQLLKHRKTGKKALLNAKQQGTSANERQKIVFTAFLDGMNECILYISACNLEKIQTRDSKQVILKLGLVTVVGVAKK